MILQRIETLIKKFKLIDMNSNMSNYKLQKHISMSLLLEAIDLLIKKQSKEDESLNERFNLRKPNQSLEQIQKATLLQITLQSFIQQVPHFQVNDKSIQLYFVLKNVHRDLSFILKTTINLKNFELHFQFKPLTYTSRNYMRIISFQRRIYAQKSISMFKKLLPTLFIQFKITIQSELGIIKIETPIYFNFSREISQLPNKIKQIIRLFKNCMSTLYEPLLELIQLTNESPHKYGEESYLRTAPKLKNIKKYIRLIYLVLNKGVVQKYQLKEFLKQVFDQQRTYQEFDEKLLEIDDYQRSMGLYYSEKDEAYGGVYKYNSRAKYVQLDSDQKAQIIANLQIREITQMKQSSQRKVVVNNIDIVKPFVQLQKYKISSQKFSDIYVAQVFYKSLDLEENYFQNASVQKKIMMIKTVHFTQMAKLYSEKAVLMQLKHAVAVFVPEYYFTPFIDPTRIFIPKSQSGVNNILMQRVSTRHGAYDLDEFVKICKNTMSLHTKTYFGLLIIQALRFLKDYQIFHLDLKPSNIMLTKKLGLKLIDFGDAYHRCLPSRILGIIKPEEYVHIPTCTMPYSPPEHYQKKSRSNNFSDKTDIFSFGVIMHNLLTSKYPFYIFSEKQRQTSSYYITERWFFAAQALSQYGQTHVFPYILLLIGRCFNLNYKLRPQLQWMSLIFRQYLYFH